MTANNEPAADLTEKDRAFRAFVREENMWKVVFYVCTPLALYQSLNQIFKIFDSTRKKAPRISSSAPFKMGDRQFRLASSTNIAKLLVSPFLQI